MIDRHHILFNRVEWEARDGSRILRRTPSLIAPMEREAHKDLHRECPPVPALGHIAVFRTLREFEPTDDTMETVDSLLFSVQEAMRSPKAHEIERAMGELTMQAIEMQKPFLLDGMIRRAA